VRIFKTRTLASDSCKSGKVRLNDKRAKASTEVKIGDVVQAKKNGFNFEFKVLDVIQKRVGSPIALTCYEDVTPEEELKKYEAWFVGKAQPERRDKGEGRPTKKQRRTIDGFKEEYLGG
jgi:ribosome-associated heat shock protein Hsp15